MSRRSQLTASFCMLLVGPLACEPGPSSGAGAVVRDSAGVRIVESTAPAWTETSAWQLGDAPALEIGTVMGSDPAYELSRVASATRLTDGRIVVLEGQSSEIRVFGPDGTHLLTTGGQGGGPGEFNFASRLWRLPGDTLMVEDRPLVKHVFFTPDGEYVRSETIDQEGLATHGPWAECMSGSLPDRSQLLCRRDEGAPPAPAEGPGHRRTFTRFVRTTIDVDTLIPLGRYGGIEQWGIRVGDRLQFAVHPFHARTEIGYGGTPMRIAIAIGPEYSIEVWTPDGEIDHIVRRSGARFAATAEDRQIADDRLATYARGDDALHNRFIAEIEPPDSLPAVTGVFIDATNHLWVRRGMPLARTTPVYDVFDPAGALLGEIVLPERFMPWEIGDDYVLGAFRDENDVPFIQLYHLSRR